MAQVLVRDLDTELVDRLKERAKTHNRSLQGEIKTILEEAAPRKMSSAEMLATIDGWQLHWKEQGRKFADSTDIIRELRDEE